MQISGLFSPGVLKKSSLCLYALLMAALVAWQAIEISAGGHSSGKPIVVQLTRGAFTILDFPPKKAESHALVLFGSGDGGWSEFEEEICHTLQDHGYEVIGINSNAYGMTDYNQDILQSDMTRIARAATASNAEHPPPLIVGGWSMGAAQAIATGGGPHPPPGLVGLLLIDPCARGRYGLRLSDQADLLPTGPGTFGADDFSDAMGNMRVAQWHAALDSIDSRDWLASLISPHREFDFPGTGHYYSKGRAEFLQQLVASVHWVLTPIQDRAMAEKEKIEP
jgi:phosphatidylglycerol lysyltransferase